MASNFFNKASLVMVPDAPIDGKLPSVKPEDRSGDFTFSRGSNLSATRVNKDGLIEKGRENLLLQSNQFDTTWLQVNSNVTSGQSGYDGSSDAWLLSKSGATGLVKQDITQSGVQAFSIYAKAGTSNWMRLLINGVALAYYDLSNGVVGATLYSTFIDAQIEDVGGGWYRCSLIGNGSTTLVNVVVADADNDTSGTSGSIYIQDAQLELGLVATEYIETTTAAVQKGILENLPRLDYSGGASCPSLLLEPQRSNFMTHSEYFGDTQWPVDGVSLDANNATSPEGLQNAYKITDDTSTGYHKITKTNVFAADGTMRTWSVFVKKGNARYCVISHAEIFSSYVNSLIFDMQEGVYTNEGTTNYFDIVQEPIDMGNGWWRIGFSSDLNSSGYDNFSIGISRGADWLNNASYAGDGSLNFYIYGAQCELGSYPTSYIPAYGSSVTRSGDTCSDAGDATTFNDSEGVLYAEIAALADDGTFRNISVNNGTTAQSVRIYYRNTANKITALIGSSSGGGVTVNVANLYTFNKIALVYQNDNAKLFVNGILEGTIQGITMPTGLNQLDFNIAGVLPFYGKAKEVIYFPTALTDDECIALTTI